MRYITPFAAATILLACFSEHSDVSGPGEDLCNAAMENVVRIRNFAFDPQTITVEQGTTVTWVNCDADVHTSTSDDGLWDSGALGRNSTFEMVFDEAGDYAYHCQPHAESMRATVVVE